MVFLLSPSVLPPSLSNRLFGCTPDDSAIAISLASLSTRPLAVLRYCSRTIGLGSAGLGIEKQGESPATVHDKAATLHEPHQNLKPQALNRKTLDCKAGTNKIAFGSPVTWDVTQVVVPSGATGWITFREIWRTLTSETTEMDWFRSDQGL